MKSGPSRRVVAFWAVGLAAAWLSIACRAAADAGRVDFNRDIRPILAASCFDCHGPDAKARKADLRLDVRADLLADRDGYPAVVPGKPARSELIARVAAAEPARRMPPGSRRPLTPAQIELLRRWVAEGAVWSEHWAFVPPRRPQVPEVDNPDWCRNPIDRFVLASLEGAGLTPSPEADRATLLRRLSLDLLGLPPAPAEVAAFQNDARPDAYERLVERLLASPHFGERWGRHWLDLARYADSDGYEDDRYRPDAFRFRDWVIAAINRDLPFDQFTIEQLAGDLLPGATYEQKLATGFHRMMMFNAISVGRTNEEEFRVKTTKDRASTTATVWLGLTFGCAECHDHKYDPLSQRDYYRFYAFFNNLAHADIPAPPLPEKYTRAHEQTVKEFEEQQAEAVAALADYEQKVLPAKRAQWERTVSPGELPGPIAAMLRVAPRERSPEQARLVDEHFRALDPEYVRLKAAVLDAETLKNNRPQPPSTQALTLTESLPGRRTCVQIRGDFQAQGDEVQPGTPAFLPRLSLSEQGLNRHDLARWLVAPGHPLTSRVAVNVIWQHLFGRGLVASAENFGLQGEPPSHPELLDWLATDFVAGGWSRKKLIRLVVTSAVYRQASMRRPELAAQDPSNRLLGRQNRFRVEAETVRDLALACSGCLELEMGGPGIQPPLPESLFARRELKTEQMLPPSRGPERYRRGVYVNVQRTFPYPSLKEFDSADASLACTHRERSNTPLQALTLLNDPVFTECARKLGLRLMRDAPGGRDQRVQHAFRLCLGREPSRQEQDILVQVYEGHRELYRNDRQAAARLLGDEPLSSDENEVEAAAWAAVARTLLNLDEFITRE